MEGLRKTAPCDVCGKEVTKLLSQSKNRKGWYCSRQCAGKGKYNAGLNNRWIGDKAGVKVTRNCVVCGVSITRLISQSKADAEWACSNSCSATYEVRRRMEAGIWFQPRRKRTGDIIPCEVCGKDFYRRPSMIRSNTRFCSVACANVGQTKTPIEKVCQYCQKAFSVKPSQSMRKYCSRQCDANAKQYTAIDRMHNGRHVRIDRKGYLWVWEPTHPKNFRGWVSEHRFLMEQQIGRYLETREHVHHKNDIKDDNRLDNLEILDIKKHNSLTQHRAVAKRKSIKDELEEYRKRFGPLDTEEK